MRRRGRPPRREITIKSEESKNAFGILSLIAAALFILSYFVDSPGLNILHKFFGQSSLVAFIFFINLALRMFNINYFLNKTNSLLGQLILIFTIAGFSHYLVDQKIALADAEKGNHGGTLGYTITNKYLIDIFAPQGAFIILLFVAFIGFSLTFHISISQTINFIRSIFNKIAHLFKGMDRKMKEEKVKLSDKKDENQKDEKMIGDLRKDHAEQKISEEKSFEKPKIVEEEKFVGDTVVPKTKVTEEVIEGALVNKELEFTKWKLPPVSLLDPPIKTKRDTEFVKRNADIIEQTLQSFGVKSRVVDAVIGPAVTQYAINIALGTKVSKISTLKTDLALALAAPTGAVRLEAPIPGTSYIGIEIPNAKRETVYIRELIDSVEMKNTSHQLPISVGKSIDGKNVITDLQKMPHLLVAGTTGSGKSVLVNSFIISLLMRKTPDEVRMIMVDPKQVELSDYNSIPHLLTPVITDMQKVLNALKWAIVEMEKRYTIFSHAHVRNVVDYNKLMGFAAMPFIIIIIDEMADLMLSSGPEVETAVVKLAQKARATGIHLVLATQRPSVNVITGLIKANISARVGMTVATQIDSRVILDQGGGESLLNNGDMLFKEPDKPRPYRIQGAWVSTEEIRRIVKFVRSQVKEVHYTSEVTQKQRSGGIGGLGGGEVSNFSDDEFFSDAVRIVCNSKKGSASLLQRKLSIGYNRAARLLDELFQFGVVGPEEGSKPRKVLVSDPEEFLSKGKKQQEPQ